VEGDLRMNVFRVFEPSFLTSALATLAFLLVLGLLISRRQGVAVKFLGPPHVGWLKSLSGFWKAIFFKLGKVRSHALFRDCASTSCLSQWVIL
jgi:hypothetical protein